MDIEDVRSAARRIAGRVHATPIVRCPALDRLAGCELWLKAENLQRIGAFKARGAIHAVMRLDPDARAKGLITYSSGNHAQAVALAAHDFGVPATIAMPVDAPQVKVRVVRSLGAEIIFAGTTSDDRKQAAHEVQAERGGVIIPPFDDPDIIAGAGTATLELVEAAQHSDSPLDALVVPAGGGGLLAGACLVARAHAISVHSVEPRGCDSVAQSLAAGRRVGVPPGPTIADGLKPVMMGELNFEIIGGHVRDAFVVDDEELGLALVRLLLHAKILVEPSGAAGLAVALRGDLPGKPRRVGVLLSGGNLEPSLLTDLLQRYGERA